MSRFTAYKVGFFQTKFHFEVEISNQCPKCSIAIEFMLPLLYHSECLYMCYGILCVKLYAEYEYNAFPRHKQNRTIYL